MTDNTGKERTWDHEPCPRDGCDGELQQQDRYNVMCLDCEAIFAHNKDGRRHWLTDENGETATEKEVYPLTDDEHERLKKIEGSRAVRSFNFDKVVVSKTDRGVEARTHKRMDRFKTGMEDVGRPKRVLQPITERQARLLYEALGEVLEIE